VARTTEAVLAEVLALPDREQRRVLVALLERLDEDSSRAGTSRVGVRDDGYETAWAAELQARVERLEQGLDQGISWDEVHAEARADVAEARRRG